METLPLLIILSIIISTGYLQEMGDYYNYGGNYPSGFPLQIAQDPARQMRSRPCQHRRSYASEQWFPEFVSKETEPLNDLQPQALKSVNGDSNQAQVLSNPGDDSNDTTEQNDIEQNNDTSKNPAPEDLLYATNRRSNVDTSDDINELPLEEGYDCVTEFDTEEYYDPRSGLTRINSQATGRPLPITTVSTEQKVINMLKDCLNKKQKQTANKNDPFIEILLAGSRRSMGYSDTGNEKYDNNKDNEESPTSADTNVDTTDEIETTQTEIEENSKVPDIIYKSPPGSLYPSKLFNELQHPARGTVIPEASRRMPVDDTRVCYACSSATNPSCWAPDSRTTVKYCHREQNCVTKYFGVKNSLTVIRDCAKSCDATSALGIEPKYRDCKVCHSDLCNSASISSYSLVVIVFITFTKIIF